jgi:hypothetical protein
VTEAKLTTKCIKKLRERGALCFKVHGGPHQTIALPDIAGCYMGRFFGIEMKMPGKEGNLTPKQAKKLRDIEEAGGATGVCTSVSQCLEVLDRIEEEA